MMKAKFLTLGLCLAGCAPQVHYGYCGTESETFMFLLPPISVSNIHARYTTTDSSWNVTGIVRDSSDKSPLAGTLVNVGTNGKCASDIDGKFFLTKAQPSDTIRFRYIGYIDKSIPMTELLRSTNDRGVSAREY